MRTSFLVGLLWFWGSAFSQMPNNPTIDSAEFQQLKRDMESFKKTQERLSSIKREFAEPDSLDILRAQLDAQFNPPPQPRDFIFPWATIVVFGLSWLLYKNPQHVPAFFYQELWLTVSIICLFLYWGPITWFVPTARYGLEMLPLIIGDTVRLLLNIALGYGAFLLLRRLTKPKQA